MNLKNLKKYNNHGITEFNLDIDNSDVEIANLTIKKLYRKPKELCAGDIVQFVNKYGDFSSMAIIEDTRDKKDSEVTVCQSGSCWAGSSKNYVSISGGSFYSVRKEDLVYIGRARRIYTTWGHFGACANGAIYIPVTVNVWRNKHDCKNTTEFLEKHYINFRTEESARENHSEYQYTNFGHQAWTNNEEISAWCILHKAFVSKVYNDGYSFEVWTPKIKEHYWLEDREVLSMEGVHDVETMNGSIRNVCYVYSENMIHKYFGKDDYGRSEVCRTYSRYFDMNLEKTKKYVRENNIHFPDSFIGEE